MVVKDTDFEHALWEGSASCSDHVLHSHVIREETRFMVSLGISPQIPDKKFLSLVFGLSSWLGGKLILLLSLFFWASHFFSHSPSHCLSHALSHFFFCVGALQKPSYSLVLQTLYDNPKFTDALAWIDGLWVIPTKCGRHMF